MQTLKDCAETLEELRKRAKAGNLDILAYLIGLAADEAHRAAAEEIALGENVVRMPRRPD